jgi:hypothetical protein
MHNAWMSSSHFPLCSFISNKALFNPHLICYRYQFFQTILQSWRIVMELRQTDIEIAQN